MVKQMIYCSLIERKGKSAVYAFGLNTRNMTGKVEFFAGYKEPIVMEQPQGEMVEKSLLIRVAGRYARRFDDGEFPDRVAYER